MSIIELKNVSKTYKGISLFEQVNLSFEKSKIYGIIGPNGSGKSVLFKMICGFVQPDQGEISIDSAYYDKGKKFPKGFGIIIDRPGYIGNKTGFENLKALAKIKNEITDNDIKKTMELVGLSPNATQKMKNYSLGMKQKIALAQAIMENQEVLILDEPFNALDIDSVENVRNLLLTFRNSGKTIILTSHNQEDITLLCDDVYRIRNGNIENVVLK